VRFEPAISGMAAAGAPEKRFEIMVLNYA